MQLTVGWEIKNLGDLCENLDSKRIPITKSSRKSGNIPYYGASGIVDYVADYIFDEDLLLVSEDGANLLARTYPIAFSITGKTWVNNHAHVLRFAETITQSFIEYYLNSISLEPYVSGMAQPKLNQKALNSIPIPIPPLPEQKRIVTILHEAFEGIDRAIANTEKNLANSREIFESYLNAIFTQKGNGWITTTVGKLVDQRILDKPLDGNHGEIHPKKSDFVKSGVPFIMASDLVDGMVDQVNCNFITLEQANSLRKGFAKDGDVLLSHKGTIGRAAVLKTSHPSVVLTPQVTYYRVIDKSVIYNRYLYYFFHSPYFQNEIKTIAGAGSTRAYIGITSQLQLKISYPKIDDQKRYADSFDALISETQRLEATYRQKIAALNELKQSILQKAFTGELTADTAKQTTKTAKEGIAA